MARKGGKDTPKVQRLTEELKQFTKAVLEDPWAHRSTNMRCAGCMWFVLKGPSATGLGRCRRHAPTMSGYPAVFAWDWCGDHKLDETKLTPP